MRIQAIVDEVIALAEQTILEARHTSTNVAGAYFCKFCREPTNPEIPDNVHPDECQGVKVLKKLRECRIILAFPDSSPATDT